MTGGGNEEQIVLLVCGDECEITTVRTEEKLVGAGKPFFLFFFFLTNRSNTCHLLHDLVLFKLLHGPGDDVVVVNSGKSPVVSRKRVLFQSAQYLSFLVATWGSLGFRLPARLQDVCALFSTGALDFIFISHQIRGVKGPLEATTPESI